MGSEIDRDVFSAEDHAAFRERLQECLGILNELVAMPRFGAGPPSLGAELELVLIDADGLALPLNRAVLAETGDPRLTVELDRFNLECNLRPSPLTGRPFAALGVELQSALSELEHAAARHGGRVLAIGILPTLRPADLQRAAMTDSVRYRVLSAAVRRLRARPFEFRIDGEDPLRIEADDVTFEGAATSFQLHLRVEPHEFSDAFNAAQLAAGPALALSGNSPTFLGHRLWAETRIALFKQAVDDRTPQAREVRAPARVGFGAAWIKRGALELFEAASAHDILLPVIGEEDPTACLRGGGIPRLGELRLQQGTVWSWNRPVYDPAAGGHLRIELRMLPAGPSVSDMLANAAFLIGLTRGLMPSAQSWTGHFPFEAAEANFYRAAQRGLDARLWWPSLSAPDAPRRVSAPELVLELLPLARAGLESADVDPADFEPWLEIFAERARSRRTGSVWQRATLAAHESRGATREAALAGMLEQYLDLSRSDRPVHTWPVSDWASGRA